MLDLEKVNASNNIREQKSFEIQAEINAVVFDSFLLSQGDPVLQEYFFQWIYLQPNKPTLEELESVKDLFIDETARWIRNKKHVKVDTSKGLKVESLRQRLLAEFNNAVLAEYKKIIESNEHLNETEVINKIVDKLKDVDLSYVDKRKGGKTKDGTSFVITNSFISDYIFGVRNLRSSMGKKLQKVLRGKIAKKDNKSN